ncbi:hypothetical protein V8C26DRAFT_357840 [Trichoderma gracile]
MQSCCIWFVLICHSSSYECIALTLGVGVSIGVWEKHHVAGTATKHLCFIEFFCLFWFASVSCLFHCYPTLGRIRDELYPYVDLTGTRRLNEEQKPRLCKEQRAK